MKRYVTVGGEESSSLFSKGSKCSKLPAGGSRHRRTDISGDGEEPWLPACRRVVPTGRHMGLARLQATVACLSPCQGKRCYIAAAADEKVRERMRLSRRRLPRTELLRRKKAPHCSGRKGALSSNSFHLIHTPPSPATGTKRCSIKKCW